VLDANWLIAHQSSSALPGLAIPVGGNAKDIFYQSYWQRWNQNTSLQISSADAVTEAMVLPRRCPCVENLCP